MIKRCNYTGRKKIPQKCIRIRISEDAKSFEASWDLKETKVPASGEVFIEAFTSASPDVQRFSYGTVGTPNPRATDRRIDMLNSDAIAFNFKVIDNSERHGCLLGISRNIRPIGDNDDDAAQQSILPINPVDLGQQVWNINFTHDRPWLEVNNNIPDIMIIAREDRKFFSLVYPAVIRQILSHILIIEEWPDPDGSNEDWRVQWLKWGIHWHPDKERPVDGELKHCRDDWLSWIEIVSDSFCTKHATCDKFINFDALGA